jgi:hypothetical protein
MHGSIGQRILTLAISVIAVVFTCAFNANTVVTIVDTINAEGQAILNQGSHDSSNGCIFTTGGLYSAETYTVTASASPGGTISPSGSKSVSAGESLTFAITPDPGYELIAIIVNGATVGGPSPYPMTYTLTNIWSDSTIAAVFSRYLDYFGMQSGNYMESSSTRRGVTKTVTDCLIFDGSTFSKPSLLDNGDFDSSLSQSWCQVLPEGIFWQKIVSQGSSFSFDTPLPEYLTPIAAGAQWKGISSTSVYGIQVKAAITAKVLPMKLITVPAGSFLAWPIKYKFTVSGRGRSTSTAFTDYFAPYIGTVQSVTPDSTTSLTNFAVAGGTIKTPPPIVMDISPAAATVGTTVIIKGYQFGGTQGNSKLEIGGTECGPIDSWSDTQIVCTVPAGAASGAVTVTTDTWNSNKNVSFTLLIPPSVTSLTQSTKKGVNTARLEGQGFGKATGKVIIDKLRAKVVTWGDSSISFVVPKSMASGVYTVTVTNSRGASAVAETLSIVK